MYFSPNQSYEDRGGGHYHETPYEVSPPAIVPAQRHKQLPEIPTKKAPASVAAPYMDYYSNSYPYEQGAGAGGAKKMLPQIPHSRIKQSPSLPQTYQKVQRRTSADQMRSSSLDHKDGEDYQQRHHHQYAMDSMMMMPKPSGRAGQFEPYDENEDAAAADRSYYNDNVHQGLQQQEHMQYGGMQQQQQQQHNDSMGGVAMTNNEFSALHGQVPEDKKEESDGFNRRDTFMKFYQRTVKHLENPRGFFQQHTADSAESQEDHKEVRMISTLVV